MQKLPFITCFILHFFVGSAQWPQHESSYLNAGAYLKKPGNFSSSGNTAALANNSDFAVGVYAEQLYSLSHLQAFRMGLTVPASNGAFQLRVNHLGNTSYSASQAGLGYGRHLSKKWDAGVAFNYYRVSLQGYGSTGAVAFKAGVLYHYSDDFRLGLHVVNPVGFSFGKGDAEKLYSSYAAGIGYDVSDKLFITARVEKLSGGPMRVDVSALYQFIDKLAAKWGVSTADAGVFFGTGVQLKSLRLDATASFHSRLGITPGLMVTYEKPKP